MIIKTFNPIITEKPYNISLFSKPLCPKPKTAIIMYRTGSNNKIVITEHLNVKKRDLKKKKFDWMVEIDMHSHTIAFQEDYFSNNNISKFKIEITASALIITPEQVHKQGIYDVTKAFKEDIKNRIQELASGYNLKNCKRLKDCIKKNLGDIYQFNGIQINHIHISVEASKWIKNISSLCTVENQKNILKDSFGNIHSISEISNLMNISIDKLKPICKFPVDENGNLYLQMCCYGGCYFDGIKFNSTKEALIYGTILTFEGEKAYTRGYNPQCSRKQLYECSGGDGKFAKY